MRPRNQSEESQFQPPAELVEFFECANWVWLAKGRYNSVMKGVDPDLNGGYWVRKTHIPGEDGSVDPLAEPRRAVRLFRRLHGDNSAYLIDDGKRWVAKYFSSEPVASDNERAEELVRLYREFGRILIDPNESNFALNSDGRPSVIDVDCLLRRGSVASDEMYAEGMFEIRCFIHQFKSPLTRLALIALLFLDEHFFSAHGARIPDTFLSVKLLEMVALHVERKNTDLLYRIVNNFDEDALVKQPVDPRQSLSR